MKICGIIPQQLVQANTAAKTLNNAVAAFYHMCPGARIETIDGCKVIGFDEGTGEPIFEGDRYQSDAEGVMVLTTRGKKRPKHKWQARDLRKPSRHTGVWEP